MALSQMKTLVSFWTNFLSEMTLRSTKRTSKVPDLGGQVLAQAPRDIIADRKKSL